VTAVSVPDRMDLAVHLAESADRPVLFPGLGRRSTGPIRLILAPDRAAFRRLSRGPAWGVALAVPRARTSILRADAPDLRGALLHELAHLALHDAIRGRVPLWFDEGYAVVAAGEFGRMRQLELNLAVVRGAIPDLEGLDAALRGAADQAETAYALAGTAVLHLIRLHPGGRLEPLMDRLAEGVPFAAAVEQSTRYDLAAFERSWRRDVRRRYSWLVWVMAGGGWALVGVTVVLVGLWRRRRDLPRKAALDEGWEVPVGADEPLDPGMPGR